MPQAIQVKLDELIRVGKAHNSFVGVEHLTDEELEEIRTEVREPREGGACAPQCPQTSQRQDYLVLTV